MVKQHSKNKVLMTFTCDKNVAADFELVIDEIGVNKSRVLNAMVKYFIEEYNSNDNKDRLSDIANTTYEVI